ncbi:hypothetical protein PsorP6_008541 [Peronosclerospora sorghi]|uniref:Uncharacterized protein n=1 Tax=Peronosclerospora sorghi TaxID=230839 RepID=A0ACC0WC40_9STRA|nr:hypothetical protein PsorP6_008541 [Peronosclerospora sorghi]
MGVFYCLYYLRIYVVIQLFFKPKDEVGIVAYGSEETNNQLNEEQGQEEYQNVQVVDSIDCPTLHMIKQLRKLRPSQSEETKELCLNN